MSTWIKNAGNVRHTKGGVKKNTRLFIHILWISVLPPPTMGCHPMLTKNANFVTNALTGDVSTGNVRNWCGHHNCSLHQWIGNWILPQFDPRMRFLVLLEPEIPYPLDVTGKNNIDVFLALMVAVVAFPLCMDVVKVMMVRMVPFFNKR